MKLRPLIAACLLLGCSPPSSRPTPTPAVDEPPPPTTQHVSFGRFSVDAPVHYELSRPPADAMGDRVALLSDANGDYVVALFDQDPQPGLQAPSGCLDQIETSARDFLRGFVERDVELRDVRKAERTEGGCTVEATPDLEGDWRVVVLSEPRATATAMAVCLHEHAHPTARRECDAILASLR